MAFSAFSEINSWMKTVFEPLATDLPGQLAAGVIPLVAAGVSLQVLFHGFAVIRGTGGSNHFLDVFAKAMRAFLVFALCLTGSAYVDEIRPIFTDLQENLTTYVSRSTDIDTEDKGSGDIYEKLDGVMQAGISTFQEVHWLLYDREHLSIEIMCIGCKGVHLDGVPAIILQAIVSFFILAFGIFAFIDVQIISQTIVIVLAFGPLFLAGFAFEATAKWAEGWLTSTVKYLMTAIVLLVVVLAAKERAEHFVSLLKDKAGGYDLIPWQGTVGLPLYEEQGKLVAIMIVLTALLSKASSIAADMVGSMGIGSQAVGMFRAAQGAALGAARGMVQGGMGGGGFRGAMKGMAYGAAGMPGSAGMGGGNKPVGRGSGSSSGGPDAPKSLARRAKQRAVNMAAYSLGHVAGKTVGQTRLPAIAKQAKQSAVKALRGSERRQAINASVNSSKRASSSFKDAWQRGKKP